jgi:hypothetical protein
LTEIEEFIYGEEFNEKVVREEVAIWFTNGVKYKYAKAPQQVQHVEYTFIEFCSENCRRR